MTAMPEREGHNIIVVSEGYRFPFSKGLMAQSLMRAGLASEDAYQIASTVQEKLLLENVKEVSRARLKKVAKELIRERFGKEAAANYEKWKLNGETIQVGEDGKHEPFSRGVLTSRTVLRTRWRRTPPRGASR